MSIDQKVYCKVVGQGPALVFLHGWGVNSAVWQPVVEKLSQHFCLYLVDLPGFGQSQSLNHYSLESISAAILQVAPESATWCGWSLGGLIATYVTINHPHRVKKLIQVACSAKFVAYESWPGVEKSVFDNFQIGLRQNPQKTLTRFIILQAIGCPSARKDSAILKKLMEETSRADQVALSAGLELLASTDLRSSFKKLAVPCLSILGKFDGLVPLQVKKEMQILAPAITLLEFEHSSHAPFISERELFCQQVIEFIL